MDGISRSGPMYLVSSVMYDWQNLWRDWKFVGSTRYSNQRMTLQKISMSACRKCIVTIDSHVNTLKVNKQGYTATSSGNLLCRGIVNNTKSGDSKDWSILPLDLSLALVMGVEISATHSGSQVAASKGIRKHSLHPKCLEHCDEPQAHNTAHNENTFGLATTWF